MSRVKKSIKITQIDFQPSSIPSNIIAVLFSTVYYILLNIVSCTIAIGFGYLCYVSVGHSPRESVLTEPIECNASASAIASVTIGRGCHLLILNENSLSN